MTFVALVARRLPEILLGVLCIFLCSTSLAQSKGVPQNDECSGAIVLDNGSALLQDTTTATGADVSSCGTDDTIDVWFTVSVPLGQIATVAAASSVVDVVLTAFDGCGGLEIACIDATTVGGVELFELPSPGGLVRVAGQNESVGDIEVSTFFESASPNDDCASPVALTAGVADFFMAGATSSGATHACANNDTQDLWYSAEIPQGQTATFEMTNSDFDSTLTVYDACGGNVLACADGSGIAQAEVISVTNPGESSLDVLVRAASKTSVDSAFSLRLALATTRPNDDCQSASPLLEGTILESSTGLTGTDVSPCGTNDAADVWYFANVPSGAELSVTLLPDADDLTLSLFDDSCSAAIDCSEALDGASATLMFVNSEQAEQLIKMRVASPGGEPGRYTVTAFVSLSNGEGEGQSETCTTNLLLDPGFEDPLGDAWSYVDAGRRENNMPRTGSFAAQFDGVSGSVSQSLVLPASDSITLSFWLSPSLTEASETFVARIDETDVFVINGPVDDSSYRRVSVDITSFGDDNTHTLTLYGASNFPVAVDDVCIVTALPVDGEGTPEGEGVAEGEGIVEGTPEGEGAAEGEGNVEGTPEGEGVAEGEGIVEGTPEGEGAAEGVAEGQSDGEGTAEGEGEGDGQGSTDYESLLANFDNADADNDRLLTLSEAQAQVSEFTQQDLAAVDANDDGRLSVAELLEFLGGGILVSADSNGDSIVQLTELLRLIQLYNAGQYACAENAGASDDGFALTAPPSEPACVLHSVDRNGDKVITLSELLRAIQLYNLGGYTWCPDGGTEDGFCG